jgi:mRNA interferase RelE/StbE
MKIDYTRQAREALVSAPPAVQKALLKQLKFLASNLHHPSLRAKKYDESQDIWQARITKDWRVYFKIEGDTYIIIRIIPHPK